MQRHGEGAREGLTQADSGNLSLNNRRKLAYQNILNVIDENRHFIGSG